MAKWAKWEDLMTYENTLVDISHTIRRRMSNIAAAIETGNYASPKEFLMDELDRFIAKLALIKARIKSIQIALLESRRRRPMVWNVR